MHPRTPALAVERAAKRYGRLTALVDLSLAVEAGEIVAIVGPNGSGKSTAMGLIAGLRAADEGRLLVCGHPAGSLPARAAIAYVPDRPTGLDELTIAEFIDLYAALYRQGARFRRRADALLAAFGLAARVRSELGSLSNGMRRLTTMVAAVAAAPPLVLVDEATAALDPEAVILFREALLTLAAQGSAVLLATQDLHFADTVADRALLLSRGVTVAEGSLAALHGRYDARSLEQVFLHALGTPDLALEVRDALHAL